jgi:arylsulfatase A
MRDIKRCVGAGLVITGLVGLQGMAVADHPAEKPNVVYILADDLGYGDVHALNAKSSIPTPNMDRLSSEGMTFTDAHSGSAVCTPTRYGVLTGRYCWRSRVKRGVLNGYSSHLIEPERATVADVFKQAGYATACIGKWHLGMDFPARPKGQQYLGGEDPIQNGPLALGFDTFYGVAASLDMPPYVFIENEHFEEMTTTHFQARGFPAYSRGGKMAPGFRHEDGLDILTKKATDYIKAQDGKPFFLYFPMTAPHKPVLPHARFRGKTDLGPYGDFIVQVDWTVGQVLNTLDELGLAENTLVILTSDNASFMHRAIGDDEGHVANESVQAYHPEKHAANHIFRGTKADVWEGGHRVPFLVRWPTVVKSGSESAQTICLTDLLATAAEITGGSFDRTAEGEDSFSFLPLLSGKGTYTREPVINHSISGMFAIRSKEWKLVLGNGSGGRQKPKGKRFQGPYQLYNLAADISETTDVASKEPERVQTMTAEFDQIFNRTEPPVKHP